MEQDVNKPMTHEENLEHNKKIASQYKANMPIFHSPDPKWVIAVTADKKLIVNEDIEVSEAAKVVLDMVQDTINAQQEQINNLKQWEKRQLDVIDAQKKLIEEQDKKIIDLAFKLAYAERSLEVVQEANTRSRP
jgi:hypothetical protein